MTLIGKIILFIFIVVIFVFSLFTGSSLLSDIPYTFDKNFPRLFTTVSSYEVKLGTRDNSSTKTFLAGIGPYYDKLYNSQSQRKLDVIFPTRLGNIFTNKLLFLLVRKIKPSWNYFDGRSFYSIEIRDNNVGIRKIVWEPFKKFDESSYMLIGIRVDGGDIIYTDKGEFFSIGATPSFTYYESLLGKPFTYAYDGVFHSPKYVKIVKPTGEILYLQTETDVTVDLVYSVISFPAKTYFEGNKIYGDLHIRVDNL